MFDKLELSGNFSRKFTLGFLSSYGRGGFDEKRRRDDGQWKNPQDAQLSLTLGGSLGVKQRKKKKKPQSKPSKIFTFSSMCSMYLMYLCSMSLQCLQCIRNK